MLKPLLVLTLLTAPAFADSKSTTLDFKITSGKDSRHYAVTLVSDTCGRIESHAPDLRDLIKACVRPDGNSDLRVEIDWESRQGDHEIKNNSTVIAARGKSFELDGGSAKLAVSVR